MDSAEILQHCLEDIAAGRRTPAECAAAYPEVPDLLAQLEAAQAFAAWRALEVSPAATHRHMVQLRAALTANRARPAPAPARRWQWAVALLLVLALVVGGLGTVQASAASLPGQGLYGVKRAAESVQGLLIPASGQAAWHVSLAQTRAAEVLALANQPQADPALIQQTAAEMTAETATALAQVSAAVLGEQAQLLRTILSASDQQAELVATVQAQLPGGLALDEAAAAARANQQSAQAQLDAIQDAPPAEPTATKIPPGQATKTAAAPTATEPAAAQPTATDVPPGQARKTATAISETPTPPRNSDNQGPQGGPNCQASNPNSQNYCTPTPTQPAAATPDVPASTPTATPTDNSQGQGPPDGPNCNANGPNSPNYCTPTPTQVAAATTEVPTSAPTETPPGNSGGQGPPGGPNCHSPSPYSPNHCTPTPEP